jgi:HSP20 family protein
MPKRGSRVDFLEDLFDLRRTFNQTFDRLVNGRRLKDAARGRWPNTFEPPIESYIDSESSTFHFRMCLAGVDLGDIEIQTQGNGLKIRGERKVNRSDKVDLLHSEIPYGTFERTLTLPGGVDMENFRANYRNGLLEITAPMVSFRSPRFIEIDTGTVATPMTA